jgi:hypothetical protein
VTLLLLVVVAAAVAVAVVVTAAAEVAAALLLLFAEQYRVSCCRIAMKIAMCSMCAQSPIILSKQAVFQTY